MGWRSIRLFLASNDLVILQNVLEALPSAQLWPETGFGAKPLPVSHCSRSLHDMVESARSSKCKVLLIGEGQPCVYREAVLLDGSGVSYRAGMAFNGNAVHIDFGFWRHEDMSIVPFVFYTAGESQVGCALLNELKAAFRSSAQRTKGVAIFLPHAAELIECGWR